MSNGAMAMNPHYDHLPLQLNWDELLSRHETEFTCEPTHYSGFEPLQAEADVATTTAR